MTAQKKTGRDQIRQVDPRYTVKRIESFTANVHAFEERMKQWQAQMSIKKKFILRVVRRHQKEITMPALSLLVGIPVRNLVVVVRYMVDEGKLKTVGNTAPDRAADRRLWVDKNTVVVAPK